MWNPFEWVLLIEELVNFAGKSVIHWRKNEQRRTRRRKQKT